MIQPATHLKIATLYAGFMDNKFGFLGIRFGVASIIDFIPGIGDVLDVVLALYLVWIAVQIHVPGAEIAKMMRNIIAAFFIGLLPVIGDIGYLFYKPNMRNLAIIKKYSHQGIEGEVIEASLAKPS